MLKNIIRKQDEEEKATTDIKPYCKTGCVADRLDRRDFPELFTLSACKGLQNQTQT